MSSLVRLKLSLNSISEQRDWVSPNVPNTLWFYSVDFVPFAIVSLSFHTHYKNLIFSARMAHIFELRWKKRAILNRSSFFSLHHHSFFSFIFFFFDSWSSNDNVFEFEVFSSQHKKSQYGWLSSLFFLSYFFRSNEKKISWKTTAISERDDDLGWFKNNILYPISRRARMQESWVWSWIYISYSVCMMSVKEESASDRGKRTSRYRVSEGEQKYPTHQQLVSLRARACLMKNIRCALRY